MSSPTRDEKQAGTFGGSVGAPQAQSPPGQASTTLRPERELPRQPQQRALEPGRRMPVAGMFPAPFIAGPFSLMRRLLDDLDQLAGARQPTQPSVAGEPAMFIPQVDVSQRNDKILVQVDLPGMSPGDVQIRVEDGALVIEGERKMERELEAGGGVHTERFYGRFQRVVPLPDGADPETAEARFENGVLEISLKVPPRQPGRQIQIKSSSQPGGSRDTTRH